MAENESELRHLRAQRLQASRARDSSEKRARALQACEALVSAGLMVTHTRVARKAGVSTWLTYNVPAVRRAIEIAQSAQSTLGVDQSARPANVRASMGSLSTDLALAREDNRRLREEVKALRSRLEQRLGVEIEGTTTTQLLTRVREIESRNTELNRLVAARDGLVAELSKQVSELSSENEAKAEVIRSMMFAQNAAAPRRKI